MATGAVAVPGNESSGAGGTTAGAGIQLGDAFVFLWSLLLVVYPLVRIIGGINSDIIIISPPLWLMPLVGLFALRLALVQHGRRT
jgi:hypothetical protein